MKLRIISFFIVNFFNLIEAVMVRIVGDSHSVASFCNIGEEKGIWSVEYNDRHLSIPFFIYNVYGVTMHRIGRDGLSFLEKWRRDIIGAENDDVLVFVFGEIDVRCHILKQSQKQNVSVDTIIEKLVDSYLNTVLSYKDLYQQLNVVVFNIVPPIDRIHFPPFEQYGTLKERVAIANRLNQTLKNKCDSFGVPFLDIYKLFSEQDGSMKPELSDGSVHISNLYNGIIKQELVKLLGLKILGFTKE